MDPLKQKIEERKHALEEKRNLHMSMKLKKTPTPTECEPTFKSEEHVSVVEEPALKSEEHKIEEHKIEEHKIEEHKVEEYKVEEPTPMECEPKVEVEEPTLKSEPPHIIITSKKVPEKVRKLRELRSQLKK